MADTKPPLAGAAPKSRVAATATNAAGLAAVAVMTAALAVAGIKPDEGKVNRTYLDVAKIPTYCFGHADRTSKVGTLHTDTQCETILAADVKLEQDGVAACVPGLRSRPYQWAASTRLAHNIGVPAFCGSGAAIHFNRGDWRGGCDLFMPWNKARVDGKLVEVRGLTLRRRRERAQCLIRT